MREGYSREYRAARFVLLAGVGVATGFLITRYVVPAVLGHGVVFLVLPILMVAALLFARALRRGRSGS